VSARHPGGDARWRPWRDRPLVFGAPTIGAAERDEVIACLESGWLGPGPRVAELERRFAAYLGAPAAVAVSSCSAALQLALAALDLPAGSEVITTSMTFCATAHAIVHAGCEPVFADCDPRTLNIDVADAIGGLEGVAAAPAAGQAGGEHHRVVGQGGRGGPWAAATAARKVSRAIGPVTRGQADRCRA